MKPSIGRIVQFNEVGSKEPWCAIIIALKNDIENAKKGLVDLQVFSPVSGGVHLARAVPYSERPIEKEHSWRWLPVLEEDDVDLGKPWELKEESDDE